MSETDKHNSSDSSERAGLQHEAEHSKPGKRNPVLLYLVILFAAAFLLLLMSYLMQQRSNQAALDNLQQTSDSAVQSLDNLIQERDALAEQVSDLESQVSKLESDLDDAQREAEQAQTENEQTAQQLKAMEYFWQIDDYYARGFYSQARSLIETFEAQGLKEALPAENTTGTDRFSPAQRYEEIYNALY